MRRLVILARQLNVVRRISTSSTVGIEYKTLALGDGAADHTCGKAQHSVTSNGGTGEMLEREFGFWDLEGGGFILWERKEGMFLPLARCMPLLVSRGGDEEGDEVTE